MRSPGVFRYLIDEAGFIDKLVVNVWGRRRKRGSTTIASARNLAIGGPGSFYARCIRGYHRISGTPYQLKYGLMRRYTHLSPFVLTMWAGGSPVTCSDAMLLLDGLMRRGYRTVVSSAEVTFDIPTGNSSEKFAPDLICSKWSATMGVPLCTQVNRIHHGRCAFTGRRRKSLGSNLSCEVHSFVASTSIRSKIYCCLSQHSCGNILTFEQSMNIRRWLQRRRPVGG